MPGLIAQLKTQIRALEAKLDSLEQEWERVDSMGGMEEYQRLVVSQMLEINSEIISAKELLKNLEKKG